MYHIFYGLYYTFMCVCEGVRVSEGGGWRDVHAWKVLHLNIVHFQYFNVSSKNLLGGGSGGKSLKKT